MSTKERLSAIKDEMRRLREEAKAKAQEVFTEETKRLFDRFPTLVAFHWTQYTPYFNDGDACVFGVNDYLSYIFEGDGTVYDLNDGYGYINWYEVKYSEICVNIQDYTRKEMVSDPNRPAIEAVSEFFRIFDEDDFLDIFGDHVQVTVTKDGTQADEYEHD